MDTVYADYSSASQSVNLTLLKHKQEHSYLERSCPLIVHLIVARQTSESHSKWENFRLETGNLRSPGRITSADGLLLQRDLDQLTEWSIRWGLTINPAKCKSFAMTQACTRPDQIFY